MQIKVSHGWADSILQHALENNTDLGTNHAKTWLALCSSIRIARYLAVKQASRATPMNRRPATWDHGLPNTEALHGSWRHSPQVLCADIAHCHFKARHSLLKFPSSSNKRWTAAPAYHWHGVGQQPLLKHIIIETDPPLGVDLSKDPKTNSWDTPLQQVYVTGASLRWCRKNTLLFPSRQTSIMTVFPWMPQSSKSASKSASPMPRGATAMTLTSHGLRLSQTTLPS